VGRPAGEPIQGGSEKKRGNVRSVSIKKKTKKGSYRDIHQHKGGFLFQTQKEDAVKKGMASHNKTNATR